MRGSRTELVKALGSELRVPASAEIVLEGHIYPDAAHASGFEHALEGPYGDHTGYYNEQVMLALALNELFVPLLQRQYPEITDFYLPPEGCSYRLAVVSGLGSKMGLDAINKWPGETSREWGKPLTMSAEVTVRVEEVWRSLGL